MRFLKNTKFFILILSGLVTLIVLLPGKIFAATPPQCDGVAANELNQCIEDVIRYETTRVCQEAGSHEAIDRCATRVRQEIEAGTYNYSGDVSLFGSVNAKYECGGGENVVKTSINIGCRGEGNPIVDMLFAVIRFLSIGVGIVLVGSMIVTGIQFTASRGNPEATKIMVVRLLHLAGAILIYVFAYAILNYIVPGQLLE